MGVPNLQNFFALLLSLNAARAFSGHLLLDRDLPCFFGDAGWHMIQRDSQHQSVLLARTPKTSKVGRCWLSRVGILIDALRHALYRGRSEMLSY